MANINQIDGSKFIKNNYSEIYENDNKINLQLENHITGVSDNHSAEDVTFNSVKPTITASDVLAAVEQVDNRLDGVVNNPDPNKDLELVDVRTSSIHGAFDTAKERVDNTDVLFNYKKDKKIDKILEKFKNKESVKIVCYGDSTTFGYESPGVQVADPYPENMNSKLNYIYDYAGVTVLNEGIPGAKAVDGVNNFSTSVVSNAPDLVIIMFGLNDNAQNVTISSFKNSMATMVKNSQDNNIEVILMSPIPSILGFDSDFYQKNFLYTKAVKSVASEFNVEYIDIHSSMVELFETNALTEDYYFPASVHLTNDGNKLLADVVIKERLIELFNPENKESISFQSPYVFNDVSTTLDKPGNKFEKAYFISDSNPLEKISFAVFSNSVDKKYFELLTTKFSGGGDVNILNFGVLYDTFNNFNSATIEDQPEILSLGLGLHFFEIKASEVEATKTFITGGGTIILKNTEEILRDLPLQNSWVDLGGGFSKARYQKNQNKIHLYGTIASGTTTDGTIISTLPVGYRPQEDVLLPVSSNDGVNIQLGLLKVATNGEITTFKNIYNNYVTLESLYFTIK